MGLVEAADPPRSETGREGWCVEVLVIGSIFTALSSLLFGGRVGTAKYITSLTLRLASDIKPHAGSIIKVPPGSAWAHQPTTAIYRLHNGKLMNPV